MTTAPAEVAALDRMAERERGMAPEARAGGPAPGAGPGSPARGR